MNVPRWVPSLVLATVLGVGITVVPVQAEALPPLNPVCWIADQRNAEVKKNCQSHDWNWPHRGGATTYDSPDRGCGGKIGEIMWGDAYILTNAERQAWFATPGLSIHSAQMQAQLVLVRSKKYDVQFWPDYMKYTWEPRYEYTVMYTYNRPQGGWFTWRTTTLGDTYTVTCNMKGRQK